MLWEWNNSRKEKKLMQHQLKNRNERFRKWRKSVNNAQREQ